MTLKVKLDCSRENPEDMEFPGVLKKNQVEIAGVSQIKNK